VQGLAQKPALLLIDGNRFTPIENQVHHCQVKGDARFASIAAASILAKTHRDALMRTLAETHPHYGLERHFGYPTAAHRQAIALHGPCGLHRKGFRLLKLKSEN
jgi:ribonuclease HII